MTEEELLAVLLALHEKTAKQIANRIQNGQDIEELLNKTKIAEKKILGDYFSQFGDEEIVNEAWNSGKNYMNSIDESIERTRRDLEEITADAEETFLRRRTHETEVIAVTEKTRISAAVTIRTNAFYRYATMPGACEVCRPLQGLVFDTMDARIGVNCPPMHPYCRCSIEPLR